MLATLEQLIKDYTAEEAKATSSISKAYHSFVIGNLSSAIYCTLKNQVVGWNVSILVNLFNEHNISKNHVIVKEARAMFLMQIKDFGLNNMLMGELAGDLVPKILNRVITDVSINDKCSIDIKDVLLEFMGNDNGEFNLNQLVNMFFRRTPSLVLQQA